MALQNIVSFFKISFSRTGLGFSLLMFFIVCANFSLSFVPIFFKEYGYSFTSLIFLYAMYAGVGVLLIPFIDFFSIRSFLLLSFGIFSLALASLAFLPTSLSFFLYPFLMGSNLTFFWIILNYLFFKRSSRETNATDSSLYMVVPGLIAMIIPPLSAVFAHAFGYRWLFGLTAVFFLLPAFFILKYIPEERHPAKLMTGIRQFKGLKTITFCEGALQYFSTTVVAVYALHFLKTNQEVGFFLGYLGLIGFVIAVILSWYSDRNQKRKSSIIWLFVLMALSILTLPLAKNNATWYAAVGIFTVIYTISSPLRLAVSLDVRTADVSFWKTREFFLNIGRSITLGMTFFFFSLERYFLVFILFALIALAYPFLVNYKLKEVK